MWFSRGTNCPRPMRGKDFTPVDLVYTTTNYFAGGLKEHRIFRILKISIPNFHARLDIFEGLLGLSDLFIIWFKLDLIAEQEELSNVS
jgi:hypothetical protein